jgi:hypothetical protein
VFASCYIFIPSYDLSARKREEKETKRIQLERIAQ